MEQQFFVVVGFLAVGTETKNMLSGHRNHNSTANWADEVEGCGEIIQNFKAVFN